ncbi:hypothetical protein LL033_23490 [Clostridium estertheticum]|uniref:hypothetical protein n=1 Tax=Clostridium estertheticum TaxID=238834 RepID=UPI001C0BA662|nr:hypothetical protein [Clostridium estertheticum]MBU3218421.1 hypothetical protein [Clostridium estertheticum]WAG55512.1 hypothetical protein LL033_23490 [Clostridium estertheticum]
MNNIIIEDKVMGKLSYEPEVWRKIELIKYIINNTPYKIGLEIDIFNGEVTEFELGINDWQEDDFEEEELEKHEEYKKEVVFLYKKYICNFESTIQMIGEILEKDFRENMKDMSNDDIFKLIGKTGCNDISNDIWNLVSLDKITMMKNRVRIIGKSKWYLNDEFGINLLKDGSYSIGNLDTIY